MLHIVLNREIDSITLLYLRYGEIEARRQQEPGTSTQLGSKDVGEVYPHADKEFEEFEYTAPERLPEEPDYNYTVPGKYRPKPELDEEQDQTKDDLTKDDLIPSKDDLTKDDLIPTKNDLTKDDLISTKDDLTKDDLIPKFIHL